MKPMHTDTTTFGPLRRLNAVRVLVVLAIAFGYASTMPIGPGNPELFAHLGYDPSWLGIQIIFFISGFLALRSLRAHGSSWKYLSSRIRRNIPLLAIFTLIAVVVIYPALGVTTGNTGETLSKLGRYFFETVSCIDPGRVLPGLLDEARYMCLIQGAIWTFRWGALLHIGTAIGNKIGLFKSDRLILSFAVMSCTVYGVISFIVAKGGLGLYDAAAPNAIMPLLEKLELALRLSWPFLAGMAYFAYAKKLPSRRSTRIAVLAGLGGTALFWYSFLAWSPAIEILLTGFWIYAAMLLTLSKTSKLNILNGWPPLALGLYLANWPTSQLLLLAFPDLGPWELIAASLPLTVGIALIAHKVFPALVSSFQGQDKLSRPPAFSQ